MHVVIFEGIHWKTFAPLSLSRPVFMLATGTATLLEKQLRHTNPTRLTLWVRPEMVEFAQRRIIPKLKMPAAVNVPLDEEPALLVSGRTLHFCRYELPGQEAVVLDEGDVVRSAFVRRPGLSPEDVLHRSDRWMALTRLPQMPPQTRLVQRLWDLIKWNEESLIEDHAQSRRGASATPSGRYHLIEEENVWVSPEARIQPGAVLDGSKGPVVIDHHASVGANAVVQGPCYVGPYAQITPTALIRPGTSIGPVCKVGGELGNSIMFGYSNKAHEGYLGDSYVGKWVNLGAGTTTSNLKNTYGEISAFCCGKVEKTGRRFLGSLIGDHAKTGIGTRLTTGAYVGFGSLIATSAIAPKMVPSFTFLTDKGAQTYEREKMLEVVRNVFARRDRMVDDIDEKIIQYAGDLAPQVESA